MGRHLDVLWVHYKSWIIRQLTGNTIPIGDILLHINCQLLLFQVFIQVILVFPDRWSHNTVYEERNMNK